MTDKFGPEVKARRKRPSVPTVAVRIPRDVFARLSDLAEEQGTSISGLLREAAIELAKPECNCSHVCRCQVIYIPQTPYVPSVPSYVLWWTHPTITYSDSTAQTTTIPNVTVWNQTND